MIVVLISSIIINTFLAVFIILSCKKHILTESLIYQDPLTGVFNRLFLDKYMDKAISLSKSNRIPLQMLIIDIDDFKLINDKYGHLFGDYVLKELSQLIESTIREEDCFARYGGEEFVLILPNTSIQESILIAKRLCDKVSSTPFKLGFNCVSVTVSIGISEYVKGSTKKEWFDRADKALYQAKSSGKNGVYVY